MQNTSWQKERTQPVDRQMSHSFRLVSSLGSRCQHDIKTEESLQNWGFELSIITNTFPVYSMSTTMKVSPYLCHDNHPAIIFLRLGTIILSIVSLVVFIIVMDAHNKVYTDGMGSFLTLFPLIFVRSSLKSWLVDRVANQERLHMVLFGPPLSF